jgi:hypothetical protein
VAIGFLAGAAIFWGAHEHLSAKETNDQAESIEREAEEIYNDAKDSLAMAQNSVQNSLVQLGYEKEDVLNTSMNQFLTYYDKIKHIKFREPEGLGELSKFTIDQQDVVQLRGKIGELNNIYSSTLSSGAAGAAAGVAITLAASAALPAAVTGTVAALASGEIGMAGVAGSAFLAAPAILFTGIAANKKADDNLEKAQALHAEAEAASEKMKTSETLCGAISQNADMYYDLLVRLNKMFMVCSGLMAGVIRKKEGRIFKKKVTSKDLSGEESNLIAVTRSLAGAVKQVIDTPILSDDGSISDGVKKVYDNIDKNLPVFSRGIQEVSTVDYNVKPIIVKTKKNTRNTEKKKYANNNIKGKVRNVFAVIIGFAIASAFSARIAVRISTDIYNLWILNSLDANKMAIWLIMFSSIAILIGRFKGGIFEKVCGVASWLGFGVLYMQFCRMAEGVNHYIIFAIVFFIIMCIIYAFFDDKKDKWQFALFYSLESINMGLWAFVFLIYAFFSKFIGFSSNICLLATTILLFILSASSFPELAHK